MTKPAKKAKTPPADTIEQLRQQITELTQALQRERADALNSRRRHDEQLAALKNVLKANLVHEFLPVFDNFERALKHTGQAQNLSGELPGDQNEWVEGVKKIIEQFEKTLQTLGVQKIKTVGEAFDPRYHEAVQMEEGTSGSREVVSEELRAGYRLGDEVIRHAMVKVKMV
ncbi:MAG: nucleotide exchange factor GrpE [Candidatus Chaera renei]|uniref:Protein GrpE n=1 Tax=Candidatus Chaera renei TaxID=2506947 RepID=A0A4Q0AG84_9BACT|nr:MAG: nucleotide exchange factor GrpE [Candidatus Chaera renei]